MKPVKPMFIAIATVLAIAPIVANAQYRAPVPLPAVKRPAALPKVIPARVTPRTTVKAPTKSVSPKAPARSVTQGNSLGSNKPQHLYGIFRTNTKTAKTSLHKFGISGGKTRTGSRLPAAMQKKKLAPTRDYSNRALQQVRRLNRQAQATKQPVKYLTRILQRRPSQPLGSTSARRSILAAEKQAVTKHALNRGTSPRGNSLPKPAPFNRIKK